RGRPSVVEEVWDQEGDDGGAWSADRGGWPHGAGLDAALRDVPGGDPGQCLVQAERWRGCPQEVPEPDAVPARAGTQRKVVRTRSEHSGTSSTVNTRFNRSNRA